MNKPSRSKSKRKPAPPPPHPWRGKDCDFELDVAIVGAGASGLYTAYRLAKSGKKKRKVMLFDAAEHMGGRILSIRPTCLPIPADLGAMRYLPHQAMINGLVNELDLKTEDHDFPTWSYFVRGRDIRPKFHVDGKTNGHLPQRKLDYKGDIGTPGSIEFEDQTGYRKLNEETGEEGLEPAELIALGIKKILARCDLSPDISSADGGSFGISRNALERTLCKFSETRLCDFTFSSLNPYQWRAFKQFAIFDGQRMFELGFWDVLQSVLSPEAFKFIEDGLGYQTVIGTWNAAEAIPWFLADFSGTKYHFLAGGMGKLTDKLQGEFESHSRARFPELGTRLQTEGPGYCHPLDRHWNLVKVTRLGKYSYSLEFESLEKGDQPDKVTKIVLAKQVVLAVSKGALCNIHFRGFPADSSKDEKATDRELRNRLNCVSAHPLLKTFLWYETPWWFDHSREKGHLTTVAPNAADPSKKFVVRSKPPKSPTPQLKSDSVNVKDNRVGAVADSNQSKELALDFRTGRVFTDNPLRMIYYHGPRTEGRMEEEAESRSSKFPRISMIMAYCDARHAEYWESINKSTEWRFVDPRIKSEMNNNSTQNRLARTYAISDFFVQRMREQFWRFHEPNASPVVENQEARERVFDVPLFGVFTNWIRPPFHGGWHTWNIGVEAWKLQKKLMDPFDEGQVLVCGEAFSFDQGWIEGALKTAERMLRVYFKTPCPANPMRDNIIGKSYENIDDYVAM